MTIVVHANFFEDIRAQLLQFLDEGGFMVEPTTQASVMLTTELYFNVRRRLMPVRRFSVHRSRELLANRIAPGQQAVINEIARLAARGANLRPFLHRRLTLEPDFDDGLLNEWGMHHLHLGGLVPEADGYMPRSREVLFTYVRGRDLYLIDVRPHGRGHADAFVDDGLFEILHTNWPAAIASERPPGWSMDPGQRLSPAHRAQARGAGLSTFTQAADGTLYLPLGGGYMTSGLSSRVRTEADRLLNRARELEEDCRGRPDAYATEIQRRTGRVMTELHMNLELGQRSESLAIRERQSALVFPVA